MGGSLAGQHRREQYAVISQPRLVADDGDGVTSERSFRKFVDQARGGHSIADDDQRFTHGVSLLLLLLLCVPRPRIAGRGTLAIHLVQTRASARLGAPDSARLLRK